MPERDLGVKATAIMLLESVAGNRLTIRILHGCAKAAGKGFVSRRSGKGARKTLEIIKLWI